LFKYGDFREKESLKSGNDFGTFCEQNSFVYMSHSAFFFGGQVQWIFLFFYFFGGRISHHGDQTKILCQRGLLGKKKFQNLPYFEGKKKKKKVRSLAIFRQWA
jgi:hypothetical protein